MKAYVVVLMLLLPLAAVGQNKKSTPLFERAVEKGIVGQYEEAEKLLPWSAILMPSPATSTVKT